MRSSQRLSAPREIVLHPVSMHSLYSKFYRLFRFQLLELCSYDGLPILAITRPTDIAAPIELLIMKPVRYTWVDPLGDHSGSM